MHVYTHIPGSVWLFKVYGVLVDIWDVRNYVSYIHAHIQAYVQKYLYTQPRIGNKAHDGMQSMHASH